MASKHHHVEHHKYAADRQPPLWERIIAGLSVLMLAGLLGFLFYQVTAGDHSPPDIVVEVVEIHDNGDDWLVTFEARNQGGETASGVVITGELSRWGIVTESANITLNFIPAKSSRRAGLFFRHDPRKADLELAPSGYVRP